MVLRHVEGPDREQLVRSQLLQDAALRQLTIIDEKRSGAEP